MTLRDIPRLWNYVSDGHKQDNSQKHYKPIAQPLLELKTFKIKYFQKRKRKEINK